jgi:hypothetical protein
LTIGGGTGGVGFGANVGVAKGGVQAGLTAGGTVTETKTKTEEGVIRAGGGIGNVFGPPTPTAQGGAPLLDPSLAKAMAHGAPVSAAPMPTVPKPITPPVAEMKKPEAPAAAPHIELNQGEVISVLREIRELLKRQVNVAPVGKKRTAGDELINNAYI